MQKAQVGDRIKISTEATVTQVREDRGLLVYEVHTHKKTSTGAVFAVKHVFEDEIVEVKQG